MRLIFVPVSNRPECAVALNEAFNLGKHLGASVKGCHIRLHETSTVSMPSDLENVADTDEIQNNNQSAEEMFAKLAQDNGYVFRKKQKSKPVALWSERKGTPDKVFSITGAVSDLIIVSRPIKEGKSKARQYMMSAILNSSRPVIILPQLQAPKIGKTISIAWNQSPQAIKAVAAAMPLLRLAKQVNIITCRPENKSGPKAKHLMKYLRAWGVKAKHVKSTGQNDVQAILNGYMESQSDLLIMGGYSHNRFKQRIFGGVTEYILNKANIPVFMLHSG
jgi:nucleotide-binding universal stress UspA family protein